MKIQLTFLLSVPLLLPLLAHADDAVSNSAQPLIATPSDRHTQLKNQATSDAKTLPKPVLEAKKNFAEEKRTQNLAIKKAVEEHGPDSPQAIEARRVARQRLALRRREIEAARRKR